MRERLGSVDATWFGMDQVENTADVVALLAFRRLPRFDLLRARLEERLVTCPRFRQRVVSGLAGPRWEDAPGFDLDRHLVASRLPDGPEALARRASAMATAPLDPAHPLWRMEAVENERDAALLVKVHHCLADGFALVSLLLALADEAPPAAGAHAVAAYRRLAPWLDPARELWPALVRPGGARDLALQAAAIGAALARLTALRAHPASALDRPLSGIRRLAWSAGAPLAAVRAAARRHGGTVHDVLLAALAGALRATVEGGVAAPLRALVPVNLRPGLPDARAGELGNRFGLVYLDLPADEARRAARLAAVRARTSELKRRPDALVTFGMLAAIGLLRPLARPALGFYARKASLVVTNVPGPTRRLALAGEPVERALFWVPHPATLGVGVSLLSYAGEVRLGVRADAAVLPRPERLAAAFDRELAAIAPPLQAEVRLPHPRAREQLGAGPGELHPA